VKGPFCSRLADLEAWATAAEPGLGLRPGSIRAALQRNRDALDKLAIESSSVASAILKWFDASDHWWDGSRTWEGTATELLELLQPYAPLGSQRTRAWPASASALSIAIRRVLENLRRHGIFINFLRPGGTQRLIRIEMQRDDVSLRIKRPKLRRLPEHRGQKIPAMIKSAK
jgi:hypothetical protein